MNLYGEKVLLRAMEPEDMEMYQAMINDPEIEGMVGGWSFPVSAFEQQRWYERVVADKRNLRFTIEDRKTGEVLGMISLTNLDWKNRSASQGIKLRSAAVRGKGYGTDALMTLCAYAFEELNLVRLDGSWVEYNEASLGLYQKCGWKIEGRKEKAVFTGGRYYAMLFGGILAEAFDEAKKRLNWNAGAKIGRLGKELVNNTSGGGGVYKPQLLPGYSISQDGNTISEVRNA